MHIVASLRAGAAHAAAPVSASSLSITPGWCSMRFRSIRFIALSSVLLIPLAAGCQSSANQFGGAEATQPIDSPTATLLVYGMGCPLCANNLDKQLLAMGNVEKVEVDMGTG